MNSLQIKANLKINRKGIKENVKNYIVDSNKVSRRTLKRFSNWQFTNRELNIYLSYKH
jgi:hypothetical protein